MPPDWMPTIFWAAAGLSSRDSCFASSRRACRPVGRDHSSPAVVPPAPPNHAAELQTLVTVRHHQKNHDDAPLHGRLRDGLGRHKGEGRSGAEDGPAARRQASTHSPAGPVRGDHRGTPVVASHGAGVRAWLRGRGVRSSRGRRLPERSRRRRRGPGTVLAVERRDTVQPPMLC